jgi:hypothetical protein
MENNQYYTPSTEEFHDGFEYEYCGKDGIWLKSHYNTMMDAKPSNEELNELDMSNTRVKHLDREDVESFGFGLVEKPLGPDKPNAIYISGEYNPRYYLHCLGYDLTQDTWHQYQIVFQSGNKEYVKFQGFIRNKSELKRILQQTGMIKP